MGKCAFPADHPLAAGMPWRQATADLTNMDAFFSPLFAEADGLLAVGCRFTQLATGSWVLRLPPSVAQIDVDAEEIGRHYPVALGVHADARLALEGLLPLLPSRPAALGAAASGGRTLAAARHRPTRAAETRAAARRHRRPPT